MYRNKRARPNSDSDDDELPRIYGHHLSHKPSSSASSRPAPRSYIPQPPHQHTTTDDDIMVRNSISASRFRELPASPSSSVTVVGSPESSLERRVRFNIQTTKQDIADINKEVARLTKLQTGLECNLKLFSSQLKIVKQYKQRITQPLDESDYETGSFFWGEALIAQMRHQFDIQGFRLCQRGVCNAVMDKRDIFCVMPTGGGKSLTYQLPALLQEGCTLVISPLVALIADQVYHLREAGIEVEADKTHIIRRLRGLVDRTLLSNNEREVKLCYVTPEYIFRNWERLRVLLDLLVTNNKIDRIVIDEAHCVSELGHDFRKDYAQLNMLRAHYPKIPILALSATCPPHILTDVIHRLGLNPINSSDPNRTLYFSSPLYRKNLHYAVLSKPDDKANAILTIAQFIMDRHAEESGIVYCLFKKETEELAKELTKVSENKIKADYYHAGRDDAERGQVLEQWRRGDIKVVCATIAFGLGINKGNVRFVVHYSISKSLENYYQESGRAGRDGENSECVLYYRPQDCMSIFSLNQTQKYGRRKVHNMIEFCEDIGTCRKVQFARYLSVSSEVPPVAGRDDEESEWTECGQCDNCNRPDREKEKEDLTREAQKIVQIVHATNSNQALTMKQLAAALKDDVRLKMREKALFIVHLLTRRILEVKLTGSCRSSACNVYIVLGPEANHLLNTALENLPRNYVTYAFIGPPKAPRSPTKIKQTADQIPGQDSNHDGDKVVAITPPRKKQRLASEEEANYEAHIDVQSNEEFEEIIRGPVASSARHGGAESSDDDDDGCIIKYSGDCPPSFYQWPSRWRRRGRKEEIQFVPDSEEE